MLRQFFPTALFALLCCAANVQAQQAGPDFINGVDVSFLDHFERNGVTFKMDGQPADGLEILKENGVNTIRLRLWHTPPSDYTFNGLDRTLEMARRVEDAGLALMLDFHYSDWWADPGQQNVPAAWDGAPFHILKDSLHNYTKYVIERLSARGTLPEIVQIGNEITSGMLWDYGRVGRPFDNPAQWRQLAELIQAADSGLVAGLGEGDRKPEVMIHIDRGGDPTGLQWFFDNLAAQGVDFDLIGLSYYPFWHGPMSQLKASLETAASRYEKEVVVAETAYPWTLAWFDNTHNFVGSPDQLLDDYPATPQGQLDFLLAVKQLLRDTPSDLGRGLVYWEPTYVAAPSVLGSPWENLTLFDNQYNALESLSAFSDDGDGGIVGTESAEIPDHEAARLTAYPNPFQSESTIAFDLPETDIVDVGVYDVTGRMVASLAANRPLAAGRLEVSISGTDIPAGIYLVRITLRRAVRSESILIHRFQ